jgi:hypothetical protein
VLGFSDLAIFDALQVNTPVCDAIAGEGPSTENPGPGLVQRGAGLPGGLGGASPGSLAAFFRPVVSRGAARNAAPGERKELPRGPLADWAGFGCCLGPLLVFLAGFWEKMLSRGVPWLSRARGVVPRSRGPVVYGTCSSQAY